MMFIRTENEHTVSRENIERYRERQAKRMAAQDIKLYEMCEEFLNCPYYVHKGRIDVEREESIMYLYHRAVADIKSWLYAVLCRELAKEGYASVSVSLELPLETLTLSVNNEALSSSSCGFPETGGEKKASPELYQTPLGIMDYYTYQAITGEENNPVLKFFRHLVGLLNRMHMMVGSDSMLNADLLQEHGIKDYLQLYRKDTVWRKLYDFFQPEFFFGYGSARGAELLSPEQFL